ncbi:MAG: bifunctional oligoribonuclease/PAP phosphatase NrnA, partial [Deltaproteobacteria bacterium]|nr:bifunctional oligoribonuclease/PAP phosphatase NrnA [Deltaproteobacteria bacterium]
GADPSLVAQNLFESQPYEAFVLLGRLLDRLKLSKDKKYSWSVIYQKDLKETGASYEDTEEFINYPRAIKSVEVAALFKEVPDGKYKVSLRSKTDVDVSQICAQFQGGGHKKAAACIISGSFEDVSQKIFSHIEKVLKS